MTPVPTMGELHLGALARSLGDSQSLVEGVVYIDFFMYSIMFYRRSSSSAVVASLLQHVE